MNDLFELLEELALDAQETYAYNEVLGENMGGAMACRTAEELAKCYVKKVKKIQKRREV